MLKAKENFLRGENERQTENTYPKKLLNKSFKQSNNSSKMNKNK